MAPTSSKPKNPDDPRVSRIGFPWVSPRGERVDVALYCQRCMADPGHNGDHRHTFAWRHGDKVRGK